MKELRDMRERAQRNIAACRQRLRAEPSFKEFMESLKTP